jgi:hypothetical protein
MPTYAVAFACNECGRLHPTKVSLTLDKAFVSKEQIAQIYKAKPLPPEIVKLLRKPAYCPVTQNSVVLDYADKLYLLPAE